MEQPQSTWLRFLRWFCPPELYESIEGDLLEQHEADRQQLGERKANWRLRWNVLRFLRPGIVLRNSYSTHLTNTGMLRNYLVVAYRNILRNPGHTSLNVLGLALGLTSCFLIGLYVRYELSFDTFHENREGIYRYIPRYPKDGQMTMQVNTAPGIAPYLENTFPEIEQAVRYSNWDNLPLFEVGEKQLPQGAVALADESFFQVFSFKLLMGEKTEVLKRPLSMLMSRSMAEAAFGSENPIGKVVLYNQNLSFEVTGVFEDTPANSHLQFSYLFSLASLPRLYGEDNSVLTSMNNWMFSTYIYAPAVADMDDFEQKLLEGMRRRMKELGFREEAADHWLQPLSSIHFTQGIRGDGKTADISYVYIFAVVAVFIIVIACFNFMNLSTARAMRRAKEVGIRKTMGAFRTQLILQFLGEAFLTVLLAAALSLVLFGLSVPWFNKAMDMQLQFDPAADTGFVIQVFAVIILTAIAAGSYPAFYLSSFSPSKALGCSRVGRGKSTLRNVLTVAQFSIAAFLITGTLVVTSQTSFMKNAKLGFDKEQVVHFYLPQSMRGHNFEVLKQSLTAHSSISSVAKSSEVPGDVTGHFIYEIPDGEEIRREAFTTIAVDYNYIDALGIELAAGRNFSKDFSSDAKQAYIVNERLVKFLGLDKLPVGPVGASFRLMSTDYPEGKIIGVVKDFHARSLQNQIEPMVMWLSNGGWEQMGIMKMKGEDVAGTLAVLEAEWEKVAGGYPLSFQFLDDYIDNMYRNEEKTIALVGAFSMLAIFVSCLGLVGLVSHLAEQRRKEIGIRKVLGASVASIISLLSWRFVRLILISVAIAMPLVIISADEWLANFAYAIEVKWWLFALPAVGILAIALLVSGSFTLKAARSNPVNSLRYE